MMPCSSADSHSCSFFTQPPAQQQHGQQQQGASSSSQRAFVTNPHICVDYAALTREYEQVSTDRWPVHVNAAESHVPC